MSVRVLCPTERAAYEDSLDTSEREAVEPPPPAPADTYKPAHGGRPQPLNEWNCE